MSSGGAHLLRRDDLRDTVFSDGLQVRQRFKEVYPDESRALLGEADRGYGRLRDFTRAVVEDLRAAWTEAFLFTAFNCALTSILY